LRGPGRKIVGVSWQPVGTRMSQVPGRHLSVAGILIQEEMSIFKSINKKREQEKGREHSRRNEPNLGKGKKKKGNTGGRLQETVVKCENSPTV